MEDETLTLDPCIDYNVVTGISSEVRERLFAVRPTSIVSNDAASMTVFG
jgi:tRNA uridine 5-carboxymethylaminomethyl modification enzyme